MVATVKNRDDACTALRVVFNVRFKSYYRIVHVPTVKEKNSLKKSRRRRRRRRKGRREEEEKEEEEKKQE